MQIPNGEITRAARPWREVAAHICWARVVPDTGPSPLHAGSTRPRTAGHEADAVDGITIIPVQPGMEHVHCSPEAAQSAKKLGSALWPPDSTSCSQ